MKSTKLLKAIKIDPAKCTGCRVCEGACSSYHGDPKYTFVNPCKSRIRIFWDDWKDIYVPIIAGRYAESECNLRYRLVIEGKDYEECTFCRASCPSRDLFRDPDTELPLLCDACGEPMPDGGPMCVQFCKQGALTYLPEREEEIEIPEEEEEKEVKEL